MAKAVHPLLIVPRGTTGKIFKTIARVKRRRTRHRIFTSLIMFESFNELQRPLFTLADKTAANSKVYKIHVALNSQMDRSCKWSGRRVGSISGDFLLTLLTKLYTRGMAYPKYVSPARCTRPRALRLDTCHYQIHTNRRPSRC